MSVFRVPPSDCCLSKSDLAIQVLARTETVSELARQHEVSRKFLFPL